MSSRFAGRDEVLEDRVAGRRTWPTNMKLRILAGSHASGAMASEVARCHRLMPSQVTTWRGLHREGRQDPAPVAASPTFVPPMPDEPAPAAAAGPEPGVSELIEREVDGVLVRLCPSTPAVRVSGIASELHERRS